MHCNSFGHIVCDPFVLSNYKRVWTRWFLTIQKLAPLYKRDIISVIVEIIIIISIILAVIVVAIIVIIITGIYLKLNVPIPLYIWKSHAQL